MSNTVFPLRTPALKVIQPLGEFFVSIISAEILLEITYSDPLRLVGFGDEGDYQLKGHQRVLLRKRLKEIGQYIETIEAAFPNAIILAANYNENGELEEDDNIRWDVEIPENDGPFSTLIIPTAAKLAAIVDGQHRLYGFKETSLPDRLAMPLVCSVYLDLPNPLQAYLFATINYNQKPVDKSQSYELYGFNLDDEPPEVWSPEKTAVFLCRKLNVEPESPFEKHILVAAQTDIALNIAAKGQKKDWAVSTATIVQGLLRLFSSNPGRDRALMHRKEISGRERKMLAGITPPDTTPLRHFYLQSNDLVIFTIVRNYFRAVSSLLWTNNSRSYIRKTVGIQALFDVLRSVCLEAVQKKNLSEEFFHSILQATKEIDFSADFFQASGTGRQRIRNSLEFQLGLKTLNDLPERDQATYKRICSGQSQP
jgi:DNA phosphorothioation-associated DGQHR protein 1